ncbi:MAG: carboxypeptidase-like regulatory domain-containing protein, partial [Bacteroidota bacterium]
MKKFLTALVFVLLTVSITNAQQRQITGTVTDAADGTPLIGVTVLVKGTTQGTTTDIDGNYSMQASEGDVLVFRFIGMESQEVVVQDQEEINVQLDAN